MAKHTISNRDDVIDSRDIIEWIEDLESEIAAEEISEDNGANPQLDDDGNTLVDTVTCGTCGRSWNGALITSRTPAPGARCPYEGIHEEIKELASLRAVADQGEGYGDWAHGEALIRDSYFVTYAQELADDIGAIDRNAQWPVNHIDWDAAAEELKVDYTEIDFDGVTYWMRS